MTEDQIQAKIFKYYHNNFCLGENSNIIFSVPNGGFRTQREAQTLKSTGTLAGVSDLIIIQENKTIFIEVKNSTGKQSPKQILFQKKVIDLGFNYHIVRTLEEFIKIME